MIPSVPEESIRIIGTYFHAKMVNFASGSEPNGDLFWGNDLEYILVMTNVFQQYIICLCLKSFAKRHIFRDSLQNWQLKLCLILCAGQSGLGIRIQDHSWTHFDSTNPITISKLTNKLPLRNVSFEISTIISLYLKLQ